jgi:hypothetical protein
VGVADWRTRNRRGRGAAAEARDRLYLTAEIIYLLTGRGSMFHEFFYYKSFYLFKNDKKDGCDKIGCNKHRETDP